MQWTVRYIYIYISNGKWIILFSISSDIKIVTSPRSLFTGFFPLPIGNSNGDKAYKTALTVREDTSNRLNRSFPNRGSSRNNAQFQQANFSRCFQRFWFFAYFSKMVTWPTPANFWIFDNYWFFAYFSIMVTSPTPVNFRFSKIYSKTCPTRLKSPWKSRIYTFKPFFK